jgi:hypothetical protein
VVELIIMPKELDGQSHMTIRHAELDQAVAGCADCTEATAAANSDATTAGFFNHTCERHRGGKSVIIEYDPRRVSFPAGERYKTRLNLLQSLLKHTGDPGKCSGCQADILWVQHRNGKAVPYNLTGINHFITCPRSKDFRQRATGKDSGKEVMDASE